MTTKERAEQIAQDLNLADGDADVIAAAITAAVEAETDRCARILERLADGYHFAGDLNSEKTIRLHVDAIRTGRL